MTTYHNYRIVRVNGWLISEHDDPPSLDQLKAAAKRAGDPVYLLAEDEDAHTHEIGYAGFQSDKYTYINLDA